MASLTVTTIESLARDYAQDNDATSANYSFTQATFWRLFNRFYIKHKATAEDRFQELASGTTGLSFAVGVTNATTSVANLRRIIGLYGGTLASARVGELEHVSMSEYAAWTAISSVSDPGGPVRWAAYRLGTATGANVGKWKVFVHPTSDLVTFTFSALCEVEPIPITAGADIPDLSDLEGYGLAAVCGAFMAQRMGRYALVQDALADVPETMKALVENIQRTQVGSAKTGVEVG